MIILTSDKTDFNTKNITKNKYDRVDRVLFIMIKWAIQ